MISVIVPVYNVEEYLEECLDSIKNQTFADIEVILVNDGSTDNSQAICKRYCERDSRFHLINQENKGLSGARNRGMSESKGEFITFVDSDDVLKEDMLKQLVKQVTSDDIDIVECWYTNDQHEIVVPSPKDAETIFRGNSKEALVSLCKDNIVRLNAVAKLFRREVIVKFPFLEGLFYEDVYGGIGILKYINKIVKINYTGYYYRMRHGSIMNREFSVKNLDLFTVCDKVEQLYADEVEILPYIYRRLFHLVLMHVVDYRIFDGNPYKEKYVEYLNRYAKSSNQSFLMRFYKLSPQNIVFFSRIIGAIQWRFEKYILKRFWKVIK